MAMETSTIGKNAGIVWQVLNNTYEMSFEKLLDQSGLSRDEVLLAIGWLARENKIVFINNKCEEIKFCLDKNFYF
jgi:hypothetical protein